MLHLNYDQTIFSIQVRRKHVLIDSGYHLYLLPEWLILCNSPKQQNPKYKVPLSLLSRIVWQVQPVTITIESFGFIYKGKLKYFHGNPQELKKLRDYLKGKLMFKDISDFYQPLNMLGRGGSSKVYLVQRRGTQEQFASKCVDKRYLQEDGGYNALFNEIQLMQKMRHEKIIHLEELYEGENTFYMVLEYLQGLSLHDMMNKRQALFDHDQIQLIIHQILTAVAYMHEIGIMHRDLKPENVMFKQQSNLDQLKIVDFGLATSIHADVFPFPKCGTPGYVAPEIANLKDLNLKYDVVCDIFSVGCIFFKLCTGKDLFPGTDYHEILKLNKKCVINLETLALYRTPKEAVDLMQKMLKVTPKDRTTADLALKHEYFAKKFESKKSKFQQFQNKQNPVFQTQNFQPTQPMNIPVMRYEDDIVEDENTTQLQVPVMQNLKTFGSFVTKVQNQARKNFKKFQTSEFESVISPQSPFNVNNFRPSLILKSAQQQQQQQQQLQLQQQQDKIIEKVEKIEFMAKIEEEQEDERGAKEEDKSAQKLGSNGKETVENGEAHK